MYKRLFACAVFAACGILVYFNHMLQMKVYHITRQTYTEVSVSQILGKNSLLDGNSQPAVRESSLNVTVTRDSTGRDSVPDTRDSDRVQSVPDTRDSDRVQSVPARQQTLLPPPPDHRLLLDPQLVRSEVHYVWCGTGVFEFQHYLSVRSVIQYVNPQLIIFHYGQYPALDSRGYNTWLEDLRQEFAFFSLQMMALEETREVCASPENTLQKIRVLLMRNGGIYMHHNTILSQFPLRLRKNTVSALKNTVQGFLVAKPMALKAGVPNATIICPESSRYRMPDHICVTREETLYPKYAWHQPDDFSHLVNLLMYGQKEVPQPRPDNSTLIPNIGHMFWTGKKQIDYLFYLSILSQLHVAKLDTVYIHGDLEPRGTYWETLKKSRDRQRVVYTYRARPDEVYGNKVETISHISDVFEADVLMRFGGVYSDVDALWVNPLPLWLRAYEAVGSYDIAREYPDYIQCGVLIGKPGAPYWRMYHDSMKVFKDHVFSYNGMLRPYKFLERHPETLYVYDHLQVLCTKVGCHPSWYPNFRNRSTSHHMYKDFKWQDALAYHFVNPTPDSLKSEQALLKGQDMFADMGRLTLKAAGLLKDSQQQQQPQSKQQQQQQQQLPQNSQQN